MTASSQVNVKIADLRVLRGKDQLLVTHALGSCIAVTVYDPVAHVGGMVHFMLPNPKPGSNGSEVTVGPHPYATAAVPALFRAAYAAGAEKSRLVVAAAGGAEVLKAGSALKIGSRNWTVLRKLLWKNNIALAASDIGGQTSRNLALDLTDGHVTVTKEGVAQTLWNSSQ